MNTPVAWWWLSRNNSLCPVQFLCGFHSAGLPACRHREEALSEVDLLSTAGSGGGGGQEKGKRWGRGGEEGKGRAGTYNHPGGTLRDPDIQALADKLNLNLQEYDPSINFFKIFFGGKIHITQNLPF